MNFSIPGRSTLNLLLCEPEEIDNNNIALIEGSRAEHVRKILKASPGENISAGIIGLGKGTAEILELKPGACKIHITAGEKPDSLYPLRLAVGMVRPIQVKRILKTAASFGISEILFLPTDLGEASYRNANIWQEYHRLLVEGASQGGICSLPKVRLCSGLNDLLSPTDPGERRIVFDLPSPEYPDYHAAPLQPQQDTMILIGSERGWTEKERKKICSEGFERRSLGRRVLTTETACTAAMALILQETGFF